MHAFLLQDWVTIRSGSGGSITQGEAAWLDLSSFLDVTAFVETKNFTTSSGSLFAAFQTAPTKDEVLFQSMNDVSAGGTGTALTLGVQTFVFLRDTALCPLARWLRWQLVAPSASSYEATFRIWIAANAPGGYARAASGYSDTAGAGGPAYVEGGPAFGPGAPPDAAKIGQLPNLPHVTQHTGFKGVGYVPGVTEQSGFKGVGYVPGVKKWQPRDWRQGIERTIAPVPRSRVPFVPPDKKVTK